MFILVSWFGLFFFQAEDGIRFHCVTGVQTCALPISGHMIETLQKVQSFGFEDVILYFNVGLKPHEQVKEEKIGRASCRERVYIVGVAVMLMLVSWCGQTIMLLMDVDWFL